MSNIPAPPRPNAVVPAPVTPAPVTPAPVTPAPVLLAADGLVVTELVTDAPGAGHRRAASTLVAHLARCVLEFLQQRRGRTGLGRAVSHDVETTLGQWRGQLDWSSATLLSARGDLVSDHAVEGSFIVLRRGRRQSFVCRIENNGRRWTCVRLAPVGILLPTRPD